MGTLSWMQDGEVIALGWTLLHFCWQGAAIAFVYAAVDRMTWGAGVRVRYGVAILALMLMPIVAGITFVEQARLLVHVSQGGHDVVASQLGVMHASLVKGLPMAAPMVESSELWIAGNARHLMPWIDGIWMAGVLLLAIRALGGWYELQLLRRRAVAAIPVDVAVSFRRVSERLRMGRKVVLRVSDEVISPMAMGIWRAAIILPVSALMQLSSEQLEAVLAHELAHIRRWDYLYNLLQTTVECLLFFHPAVWWVSRCTRDLREACCDEVAARSCEDPVIYAEALLQLEEQRSKNLQLAMAVKGHDGSLLIRVRQILGEGMTMERTTTSGVRVAVAGTIVLGLLMGSHVANGLNLVHRLKPVTMAVQREVAAVAPKAAVAARPVVQAVEPVPAPVVAPAPVAVPAPEARPIESADGGGDYIKEMRAAGYPLDLNNDLDTLISLRSVGVTPEYAKEMAGIGLGTPTLHELVSLKSVGVTPEFAKAMARIGMEAPTLHDLVALKSVGVTPEFVASMKASGIAPENFHEAIAEASVGVTPEYAKSIASMGFGSPDVHELIGLRAQGVTPEYAAEMKASGIPVTDLHELMSLKALGVTPEYAKSMAAVGFPGLSTHELIAFRAQGVTPEYVQWVKKTFPDADMHMVTQGAAMHVDADFVARAKAHGFNDTSFDKLVKLKITGLLD